ncbi:ubiquitin-conjugating enzyme/RWD-like protein [Talaromyces proteolyticus]|uniref:Ubiquitin-conjugating enzyme/RWD-like protein n=1 Tax=Talaromyces proteolyticus TaxID=1131652 RepID=A0AAD4KQ05_9EURO|nr:ubiquitin-conjugating enzyme/RWD-like protein [Talaromyces proteolyticus]KAH8696729.1 ubiquitin-conjugating enzyme/RWD-like protein [Talaromyces proteolyticus]
MSPTIRRLMKEAAELSESSSSPSPHFHAHPVSDSNLFDWHFTMTGPPAPSPYAGGIYHGRIVLPPTYPLRPPSFRFLTPSGRFEVNREICLSISGHHEETWQPAWGIRTALTAIRSFMDGDAKGQLGGLDATDDVRRMWAEKSRSWKCDCMEGRTNEQVLNDWRELCLQKGISVDEEGRETVPAELNLSYKKSSGQEEKDTQEGSDSLGQSETIATVSQKSQTSPAQNRAPQNSPTSHPQPQPQPAQSEAPRPTLNISPSPSTTAPTVRTNTQPSASHDNPWLDRAIIGVLIALVFMIMRRIAASDPI